MVTKKRIVVTGSSSGIGKTLCELLLGFEDWEILGVDKNPSPFESSSYNHLVCDLTSWKDIDSLLPKFANLRMPLHALVNCAGIMPSMLTSSLDATKAQHAFSTNTLAPLYVAKTLLKPLARSKEGHIINVTSIAADVYIPGEIVYSATKAALKNITQNMSSELSRFGIRVNSVAPALVMTPMTEHLSDQQVNFMKSKQASMPTVTAHSVASAIFSLLNSPGEVNSSTIYVGGVLR